MDLKGKVAIVTGAGKPDGIGRACVERLKDLGASVVLCELGGTEAIRQASVDYPDASTGVAVTHTDVTKAFDAEQAVALAEDTFGGLDILVNNAGVGVGSHDFLETPDSDWSLSMSVNLMGPVNFCKAAIPAMLKRGGGSIINISSLSGLGAIASIPACYTASKFAAIGFTKQLAIQYAPDSIRVNAICPGSVRTDMMKGAMELLAAEQGISVKEAEALEASTIPAGRAANPSEVADAVAFLAGDGSAYMTGVALPVSGGMPPGL
jgi:3-oxoacyl-[acyl-carrier protein] reductase